MQFIAKYDTKGARWRISTVTQRQIGSKKKREDAIADLVSLDHGTHKSQAARLSGSAPAVVRHSDRIGAGPVTSYAADTREGNYVPGSGRGNKKKCSADQATLDALVESPIKVARGLLDTDCRDPGKPRAALSKTVDYTVNLKQKLGILCLSQNHSS